jgi:hypothetical protein
MVRSSRSALPFGPKFRDKSDKIGEELALWTAHVGSDLSWRVWRAANAIADPKEGLAVHVCMSGELPFLNAPFNGLTGDASGIAVTNIAGVAHKWVLTLLDDAGLIAKFVDKRGNGHHRDHIVRAWVSANDKQMPACRIM